MSTENLPRPFGNYLLTAALGEDGLGRVYRALRLSGDTGFVRLRILESSELSADAMLDAIEEGGEVHAFLKNPAIARGVDMDSVDGVPYIAWNEPSGRTLGVLLEKTRSLARRIPVEHALLIAEKVATALDHAYNTTIDGDRTLHGLVWPGFVVISDDGEIRLSGFGIAPGVLASIARPRLAGEVGPYLAPEERATAAVGKNSDVFSVGAILLELLTGDTPPPDPLLALKGSAGVPPLPIAPEIQAVLRMTLGPAETRYKSSGDLRRELGKLLFSGPYSPSTFNLAYFLNDLFRDEIEAETRARAREARLDASAPPGTAAAPPAPAPPPTRPPREPRGPAPPPPRSVTAPGLHVAEPSRRGPLAIVGGIVVAAAVGGGIFVLMRRPESGSTSTAASRLPTAAPSPTLLPEFQATPTGPTTAMTEAQFRDEVSRRLSFEVQKLEAEMRGNGRDRAAANRRGRAGADRGACPRARARRGGPGADGRPDSGSRRAGEARPDGGPGARARRRARGLARPARRGRHGAAHRHDRQARLSSAGAQGADRRHRRAARAGVREGRPAAGRRRAGSARGADRVGRAGREEVDLHAGAGGRCPGQNLDHGADPVRAITVASAALRICALRAHRPAARLQARPRA